MNKCFFEYEYIAHVRQSSANFEQMVINWYPMLIQCFVSCACVTEQATTGSCKKIIVAC